MKKKTAASLALACTLAATDVSACSFHITGMGGFDLAHPGSLGVAVAVSDAMARGVLTPAALPDNYAGLIFASQTLQRVGRRLNTIPEAERADFHLLLVGRRLWTGYTVETTAAGPAYGVALHTATPEEDTPVVLTSYDVLAALETGAMTVSDATDAGVLTVLGAGREEVVEALAFAYAG